MLIDMTPSDVLRLGRKAKQRGVQLLRTTTGETFATSSSRKGVIYHTTAESCDCPGFEHRGRCMHIALETIAEAKAI